MFSILQNNLLLNNRKNVTAFKFAISDVSHNVISMEPFSFYGQQTNIGALRVSLSESSGDFCVTRSLDSFCFDEISFIKMDIQGSELKALAGGGELIKKSRPFIFIEIEEQHLRALRSSTKELMEKLFSLGYGIYRIETEYPCDHICIPLEKVAYFEEQIAKNYRVPISEMIYGKEVNVYFRKEGDQNYSKVELVS
jgi:FkbM family methyltransferase